MLLYVPSTKKAKWPGRGEQDKREPQRGPRGDSSNSFLQPDGWESDSGCWRENAAAELTSLPSSKQQGILKTQGEVLCLTAGCWPSRRKDIWVWDENSSKENLPSTVVPKNFSQCLTKLPLWEVYPQVSQWEEAGTLPARVSASHLDQVAVEEQLAHTHLLCQGSEGAKVGFRPSQIYFGSGSSWAFVSWLTLHSRIRQSCSFKGQHPSSCPPFS